MRKLLSLKYVSNMLDIPVYTLQKMCRLRKIPCYRLTRHYKFKESEINEWLESKKQEVIKDRNVVLVKELKVYS